MTPKYGSGQPQKRPLQKKPPLPARGTPPGQREVAGRRMVRKEVPAGPQLPTSDDDRPILGDINEPLDQALEEVEEKLAREPGNKEHHVRKYKILRRMGDRQAMRVALQKAAQACGDPFFGVKLAEALEEEGAYTRALEWRRWVHQFQRDDPDTVRRLAATAVRAGALETAEQAYTYLIELRKEHENPLGATFFEEMLGRGLDPGKRRQLQQIGIRLLARALATRDTSASLLEMAARLAYRVKDYRAAQGFYERAIATNPDHKNARQWKVELLKVYALAGQQDRWKALNRELIEELKAHLAEFRGDSRAWITLADQQIQAGQFEDALGSLKDALLADSRNAQALWELGRLYVRMGRSQEAVAYYEDIINDPHEKKAVRRAIERALADLFFKLGRYRDALNIYLRNEEANIRMIAPIYEAVGEIEEAEELYTKSVAQSPRDAKCHLGLAEYWVRRQNWRAAAEAAREGLRCSYATEEVHSRLAVALATAQMKMGQVEEALQTMHEICDAYPDSIHQVFRKVKLLLLLGRKQEAIELAEEVRQSARHQTGCAPSNSELWTLLGDCSSLLGDHPAAEEAYSNSLRYDAMDAAAVRGLGVLAEKQGDLRKALELYRRFVVLDPLNLATPVIRERIRKLEEQLGPEGAAAAPRAEVEITCKEPVPEEARPTPRKAPGYFPGLPHRRQGEEQRKPPEGWLGDGKVDEWFNIGNR